MSGSFHRGRVRTGPETGLVRWEKRLRLQSDDAPGSLVVGVARTHKYLWVGEAPTDYLYMAYAQLPRQDMTVLVESAGDAAIVAAPLR